MRIAGKGKMYAAPELVCHYGAVHDYKPPDEFIAAVLAWDESAADAGKAFVTLGVAVCESNLPAERV